MITNEKRRVVPLVNEEYKALVITFVIFCAGLLA